MNKVTIYIPTPYSRVDILRAGILDGEHLRKFWDTDPELNYEPVGTFYTAETDVGAAEAAFDLSNNPSRDMERQLIQGRTASLSVGGVVKVEERSPSDNLTVGYYLCLNEGWEKL